MGGVCGYMLRLPDDKAAEMGNRMVDIYNSCRTLDDFLLAVLHSFPDDPTMSYGYWLGLMAGRLEGKSKMSIILRRAEKMWLGEKI